MTHSLINKYLAGHASDEEARDLFNWIDETPENRDEFIQYKKLWALTATSEEDSERVWDEVILKRISERKRIRFKSIVRNAAAVILILGFGALAQYIVSEQWQNHQYYSADASVNVPLGQMTDVVLPDGTTVQLNSGSKLLYSGNFSNGKRIVTLKGEAFFHVAKDKKHPFVVETQFLDFKVYGTSFNVQAYPDESETNTTLVEGSLGVLDKSGTEYTRLVPGENITYHKNTRRLEVKKVKLDLYTSWRNGLITFRNESLKNIAKDLERWYNVKIVFKDQKLKDELYYGTIMKNKPIDQILDAFKLTSGIQYQMVTQPDKPTIIYWSKKTITN